MDILFLARMQFAITCIYHFFFVPLTLGLGLIVAVMQTAYFISNNEIYKRMTKFWGKLFLINFSMGVVTGIVMEFQFGMNWSEYSRYVGDIFGAPLAIEALLAFFLESTFLGVWIFGWEKVSKRVHLASIWLVAIGANLSALWILIANSFMQQPVGYGINTVTGRAEMIDFFQVITNPNVLVQFPHTVMAGLTTGAFFVMGISIFHLMKKREKEFFSKSFKIAAIAGTISIATVVFTGHSQAQHMVETQPMKMAAAEALWYSEDPASFSLISIGDPRNGKDVFAIRIPKVLSFLAYNKFSGKVEGLLNLQSEFEEEYGAGNYIPPVVLTYWSFRIMVGAGGLMMVLAIFGLYLVFRRGMEINSKIAKIYIFAIGLPYIANTFGWIMTEVGRMPWVVYGLLKIEDAISPNVGKGQLLATLIGFILIYGILMIIDVSLLIKYAKIPPNNETKG